MTKIGTNICTNTKDAKDNQHQWKHAKIPSQQKESMKSSEDMMNLKRGSLASMKQQQIRRQK